MLCVKWTENKLQGKEILAPGPSRQKLITACMCLRQRAGKPEYPARDKRLQSRGPQGQPFPTASKGPSLVPCLPPQGPGPLKQARPREKRAITQPPPLSSLGRSLGRSSICLELRCKVVHEARGTRKRLPTTGVTDEAIGVIQASHGLACLPCPVDAKPALDANA